MSSRAKDAIEKNQISSMKRDRNNLAPQGM